MKITNYLNSSKTKPNLLQHFSNTTGFAKYQRENTRVWFEEVSYDREFVDTVALEGAFESVTQGVASRPVVGTRGVSYSPQVEPYQSPEYPGPVPVPWLDYLQGGLDVAGVIPVLGEPADLLNAGIYTSQGDYLNAGLSVGSSMPFLGWGATIGKYADEAATASKQLVQRLKPYAKHRPTHRKGVVEAVWNKEFELGDGKVFDPNETWKELRWDKTRSRAGQWDMGHRPGEEYWRLKEKYDSGIIDKKEFLRQYNDPGRYRPEDPSANRSRRYEDKRK